MRFVVLVFLIVFALHGRTQDSTYRSKSAMSVDLFLGQKVLFDGALNERVGDFDNVKLGQPLTFLGIGVTTVLMVNRKFTFPAEICFSHLIPQSIELSDSVSGRLSGFNVGLPLAGYDLFNNSRNVDLLFGTGFNAGRIRLFGDARLEQVNAYFAPYFSFSPRFVIGKVVVRLRMMFEFDITRSSWRNVWFSSSPKVDLGPMKSSGLSSSISIGWVFD